MLIPRKPVLSREWSVVSLAFNKILYQCNESSSSSQFSTLNFSWCTFRDCFAYSLDPAFWQMLFHYLEVLCWLLVACKCFHVQIVHCLSFNFRSPLKMSSYKSNQPFLSYIAGLHWYFFASVYFQIGLSPWGRGRVNVKVVGVRKRGLEDWEGGRREGRREENRT